MKLIHQTKLYSKAEGKTEQGKEIALKLLKKGMQIEEIMELTELSEKNSFCKRLFQLISF